MSPFVVRSLGTEIYGTWALLGSMVGYLGLLDLGVRGAVTRFVARLHAEHEHREAQRVASAALFLFTVSSLVAVLAGVIIALVIGRFSVPRELLAPARIAVILSAMSMGSALISGVYAGITTARQRFDLNSAAEVGVEAFRIVLVVLALRAGHGLVALPAIQLVSGVCRLGVCMLISRRVYPELHPSLWGFHRHHVRQIFSFSLTTTWLHAATAITLYMDTMVIGWFLPVARVTYFAIAANLPGYARQVVSAISETVTPRVSALEGGGAIAAARRVPVTSIRIATTIVLPIAVTFILRGETFIGLWMGQEFAEVSGQILRILSVPLWLDASRVVMTSALMGMNRHRMLIVPYLAEAALSLALSITLVQSYGLVGVALGTAIPRVLVSAGVLPLVWARVLEVPPARLWIDGWVRPTMSVTLFALGTYAMERLFVPDSLVLFFAQTALLLPLAAVGAWVSSLTPAERLMARGFFGRVLPTA